MEPIISPSTFYWIEVIDNVKTCSAIFFGIGIVVLIVLLIAFFILLAEDDLKGYFGRTFKGYFGKTFKKTCVIATVATTISGFFCLFTPSQETLITMIAAKYITPDNITAVGGTVEDSVEFITNEIIRVVEASDDKDDTNS